jgi:hypothetical protein
MEPINPIFKPRFEGIELLSPSRPFSLSHTNTQALGEHTHFILASSFRCPAAPPLRLPKRRRRRRRHLACVYLKRV